MNHPTDCSPDPYGLAGLLVLGLLAVGAGVAPRGPGAAARADQPENPPAREKAATPRPGADLAKIDRTIRKEPAYLGKPRYALVVLGPKAGQPPFWRRPR